MGKGVEAEPEPKKGECIKADPPRFTKTHQIKRKKKYRKEVLAVYDSFKNKNPEAVKEEIVVEGVYFTLARVTVELADNGPIKQGTTIIGEGIARRSGIGCKPDQEDYMLANSISLGRARIAAAFRLAAHKPWIKMRSGRNYLLMA
jgi:hypothetical protein